ncbi:hypothetical protein ACO1O0_007480 [Amphichorda felina]
MAPVTHVVMFQPKAEVSAEVAKELFDDMFALKDKCIHPATNKPYIKSSVGGKDNSIEGLQGGITHIFIVEFESAEDREYYVKEDAAHKAFLEKHFPNLAKAQVIDFTPGVF